MDYVEWVEAVLTAVTKAHQSRGSGAYRPLILSLQEIAGQLGFSMLEPALYSAEEGKALLCALSDLENLGLISLAEHPARYMLTAGGKKLARSGLEALWPGTFARMEDLDPGQLQLLAKIAELGQVMEPAYARMRTLPLKDVCEALGLEWGDRGHADTLYQAVDLEKIGLLQMGGGRGGETVEATYAGAVLITRKEATEWQMRVRELLPDWENTNVDFKRELNLRSNKEKAEFVRDILGLATTKCRGRRFLIIGFGPKSHTFEVSVDPKIDQDRLEQILQSWTEPTPRTQYVSVPWEAGRIAVIEVIREPEKIPYKVKGTLAHISNGAVYVRHGSQTEPSTPAELADLLLEGETARLGNLQSV